MIEQLVTTYGNFHDALILNVEHKTNVNLGMDTCNPRTEDVVLVISCYNELNDYHKDIVELKFTTAIPLLTPSIPLLTSSIPLLTSSVPYTTPFIPSTTSCIPGQIKPVPQLRASITPKIQTDFQ
jgi:hypothetical protein